MQKEHVREFIEQHCALALAYAHGLRSRVGRRDGDDIALGALIELWDARTRIRDLNWWFVAKVVRCRHNASDCWSEVELLAYKTGRLSGPAERYIELHLEHCARCRADVAQWTTAWPSHTALDNLLERARDAFTPEHEFVRRFVPKAAAIARRYRSRRRWGDPTNDLDDVMQDILVKLWRRWSAGQDEVVSDSALLWTAMSHRIIEIGRRSVRDPVSHGIDAEALFEGAIVDRMAVSPEIELEIGEAAAETRAKAVRLRAALNQLSPAHRDAYVAIEIEGEDRGHYADRTHLKPGTVRQHLLRARTRLTELLTAPSRSELDHV